MSSLRLFITSSLGKKYLMAITGLGLFGFVIIHMLGNLQIFIGRDTINAYGAFLKSIPELLWSFRLGLLAMVAIHIYCAVRLTLENRAARGVESYEEGKPYKASYASRTMAISGVIVLAFIVYHILHFTVGVVDPSYLKLHDEKGRHDVYQMVINGFSHPLVSFFYILSMGLLCMHLSHGVGSLFQSLGLKSKAWGPLIDTFSVAAASVIFVGNISIPIAVMLGWIK